MVIALSLSSFYSSHSPPPLATLAHTSGAALPGGSRRSRLMRISWLWLVSWELGQGFGSGTCLA